MATPERAAKPDYGIDAPGVIGILFAIGIALLLVGWFQPSFRIGPVIFFQRDDGDSRLVLQMPD